MNKLFLYSSLLKCWCYVRISFLQIVKFAHSDDTPVNSSLVFSVGPCCSS